MTRDVVGGGGAFVSHPLEPSVLDYLWSDLVHSMYTDLLWYKTGNCNLPWSLLAVRLSKWYRKEWRRWRYLENLPFRLPMTVHFLPQASLPVLRMPSDLVPSNWLRPGSIKLKTAGFYWVQMYACSISLPISLFFTIFRLLFAKFFSPGPKAYLAMPSNSTWV